MKALVVDDDPAARHVLKRILMRDLHSTVVEAEDGVEALEQIERHQFSVVLLDVRMPVMDGLEALEQIRKSPQHASLITVIMTAQTDEAVVRRALSLGVTDYLLKTSDPQYIVTRLNRALSRYEGAEPSRDPTKGSVGQALTPESIVMVVDGDSDFRFFLGSLFQSRYRLREAPTAAQALKMFRDLVPAVVIVGEDVGVMGREAFVKKAREDSRMAATMFVAVAPPNQVAETRRSGFYDDVAVRSFVPEVFLRQLGRFFAPPTALKRFVGTHPALRRDIITATEQVFGMVLAEDISVCVSPPNGLTYDVGVSIDLDLQDEDLVLTLALAVDAATSRLVTARMIGAAVDDVPAEDANSGLLEIANIIGGRVGKKLGEHGRTVKLGLPAARERTATADGGPGADGIALAFAFEKGQPIFAVSLYGREQQVCPDAQKISGNDMDG